MKVGMFTLVAALLFIIEATLSSLIEVRVAVGGVRPSLVCVLALYVALWAPRLTALWCCLVLGVLVDLMSPMTVVGGEQVNVIGPNALGFSFAAAMALQIRSMVLRRQLFAMIVMCVLFVAASSIVVVALMTVRSWIDSPVVIASFSPAGELLRRLLVAVYTGLAAIPLGWILLRVHHAWGFQTAPTSTNWR